MRKIFSHGYNDIISLENLLGAWKEFLKGKKKKRDVQEFHYRLSENLYSLHQDLKKKTYFHNGYWSFNISDPKPRNIHKATVRDRLLHHALYRMLYPFFDRTFIADSYSCRWGKGTHKAMDRFGYFSRKASCNHKKTVWVLKCDIKKFFASINQHILLKIVDEYVADKDIVWLISNIVQSFHSTQKGVGLPLGNLTSQLLVNVYMNKFDQFVKHRIKAKYYIRYADDFVILSDDKSWLEETLTKIKEFLLDHLKLKIHPDKVFIKTFASGVDFLGWVHFPTHRVLRTTTRRRMLRNTKVKEGNEHTFRSYLGMLKHGNTFKLSEKLKRERLLSGPCTANGYCQ